MKKRRYTKRHLIKIFTEYGIHLWLILLLANIVLFYAFQIYLQAANCLTKEQIVSDNRCLYTYGTYVVERGTKDQPYKGIACGTDLTQNTQITDPNDELVPYKIENVCTNDTTSEPGTTSQNNEQPSETPITPATDSAAIGLPDISPEPTTTPVQIATSPTAEPVGPVLDLSFILPGIGSGSAVMDPIHKTRPVMILLYGTDQNPVDNKVKPQYLIERKVSYDNDPRSPTFTQYLGRSIDLGAAVPKGQYQIVIATNQSLDKIVKDKENMAGGKVFSLTPHSVSELPLQKLVTGDIYPDVGDNIMDINDYNTFVSCFSKQDTCKNPSVADLDDNGSIDGIDYNILLLNFQQLLQQGYPVPTIDTRPSPTIISKLSQLTPTTPERKKPTKAPTKASAKITPGKEVAGESNSGAAGIVVTLFIFGLLIGTVIIAYFKSTKFRAILSGVMHKNPSPTNNADLVTDQSPPTQDGTQASPQQGTGETLPTDQPQEVFSAQQPSSETDFQTAGEPQPTPEQPETETPVEQTSDASTQQSAPPAPDTTTQASETPTTTPAAPVQGKEYYVKKKEPDADGKGFWLTITDDNGPIDAHYTAAQVEDGFAIVKGEMKTENGKTYMEITDLTYEH